jgi:hypothetical protein
MGWGITTDKALREIVKGETLNEMTKAELRAFMEAHKLPYREKNTATNLRDLIENYAVHVAIEDVVKRDWI